jgi:hypothetical protein
MGKVTEGAALLTTEPSKTSVTWNFILEQLNLPRLLHKDWVIAWSIAFKATRFIFPIASPNLRSTMITSPPISCQSIQVPIGRFSTWIRPFRIKLDLLTMYPSMNSVNLGTWKLAIYKGMVLVKAVLPPKMDWPIKMEVVQV